MIGAAWTMALAFACDSRTDEPPPTKTKSIYDLKQTPPTSMTPEQLAEARKKAGLKTQEEVLAEARATLSRREKEQIKERLTKYRELLANLRKKLDDLEKAAPKWAEAKDPQAAFDKWAEKYKAEAQELSKGYAEMNKDAEGGDLQGGLDKAFRTWEDLNNDLAPDVAKQEQFKTTLADIRAGLDAFAKAADEIEKDESIKVEPPEGEGKADAKADGKADKKADAKADKKAG
jgi:hypothetical protein